MKTDSKNKTCMIVARVSSKDQEEEGFSLPAQLKLLNDHAEKYQFIVKERFDFVETASKKEQRNKFEEKLKLATQKNIKVLIFEKVDRVTRNLHSSVKLYDWLEEDPERELHCVKDSLILHKNSKSQDKLNWDIKVAMAKNYSDNLSEEVRKGKKEKIEQGWYPGAAPQGYKSVEGVGTKRKIQVIDEETSKYIIQSFELYVTGNYSLETLAEKMNKEGMRNKKGRKMTKNTIHEILKNPYYCGDFRWNGNVYKNGKHEPLISKDLFNRVQQVLTRKPDAKYNKHFYMLKGLVRCGECGGTISWYKKKGHVYGRCNHHRDCNQTSCGREDQCDDVVKNALKVLKVQSPRLKEWIVKALKEDNQDQEAYLNNSLDTLNAELKKLVGKQSRLYDDKLSELITLDMYKTKNSQLEDEKDKINDQIEKLNKESNRYFKIGVLVYLVAQYADEIYDILDPNEISSVMKYIFGEITLYDGNMQYKYTEPFKVLKKAVDLTNESSKMLEKASVPQNIFEPMKKIEGAVQKELVEAVHHEWR